MVAGNAVAWPYKLISDEAWGKDGYARLYRTFEWGTLQGYRRWSRVENPMHGGRILSNASYGAVGIDAVIGCSGAGAVICARGGKSSMVFPSNPAHRSPTCVWLAMEMGEAEAKNTGLNNDARNLQKRTDETPRRLT